MNQSEIAKDLKSENHLLPFLPNLLTLKSFNSNHHKKSTPRKKSSKCIALTLLSRPNLEIIMELSQEYVPAAIVFKKPGSEETHEELCQNQSLEVKRTLYSFEVRGDWFNPSIQPFAYAFQLATSHPIYGTSLRIYDYIGTVRERNRTYYAFITEQTCGGNGPRRSGRHWASGAIAFPVSNDGRFVNPAQICLIERNDRDPEIFGNNIVQIQGGNYKDGFRKKLKETLKHYTEDHPRLFESLCGIYTAHSGTDKWQSCMRNIWRLLKFEQMEGNGEYCTLENCSLLHELRVAWKDNFLLNIPPPALPPESSAERLGRARGRNKVKPSHAMCKFLTGGRMVCFDSGKHRIEWAHPFPRRPLQLQKASI